MRLSILSTSTPRGVMYGHPHHFAFLPVFEHPLTRYLIIKRCHQTMSSNDVIKHQCRNISVRCLYKTRMPPPTKYVDFELSLPFTLRAKHNKDEEITREYTTITCPHCNKSIGDLPVEMVSKLKSTRCKAHLEVCVEFKAKGGNVAPAPTRESAVSKQMAEMEARLCARAEARHVESMAQISRAFGLGDPDATTQGELIERNKRKREEEATTANAFESIANDAKGIKFFRTFLHSDNNAKRKPEVNAVCEQLMAQLLDVQKHKK